MKILISACLLGLPCRYDGAAKAQPWAARLVERHTLVPVCPEQLGGLPTPRNPSERQGDRVVMNTGVDVTEQYCRGARCALELCRMLGCEAAVLKERSPSCGSGEIYDGTFSGTRIPGDGVAATLFRANGIEVYGESQLEMLLEKLKWDEKHDTV